MKTIWFLNKESVDPSETMNIIEMVDYLSSKANMTSFVHCEHSANFVARLLARATVGLVCSFVQLFLSWERFFFFFPSFLYWVFFTLEVLLRFEVLLRA